ncbi:MAG: hypothetical protein ACKV2T_26665 [Kofleriaceae bacterium]
MQLRQIALACALLAGCGDDGGSSMTVDAPGSGADAALDAATVDAPIDSSGGAFTASGTITTSGPANPVFVAWQVSSGSPDYLWKFGEGTSTATTFVVTMGSVPPPQALNSYGLAIGIVVMLPDGIALPPDGMIDESAFDPIAVTGNHWIIYKASGASLPGWPASFPDGYACGVCVPAAGGATFDTFAVTACDGLEMVRNLDNVCNWT